jgi:hypothetical protein
MSEPVRPLGTLSNPEAIGRAKGKVEQGEEALRTMQTLGQNMAWLLKRLNACQPFTGTGSANGIGQAPLFKSGPR